MNLEQQISESIATKVRILNDKKLIGEIEGVARLLISTIRKGKKILIAGNGGSAADAQHFSAELVGRFFKERRGYPVVALTTDTSFLTAWGNDDSFENIFSRQIQALGRPGDTFVGISTSGESVNLIKAFNEAKKAKLKTVALLGKGGGLAKGVAEISLVVPSDSTPRIQESHIMLIHLLCERIEASLIALEK